MGYAEKIIGFYKGEAPDHCGRQIDEIWQMSHFWLEHTHDYIQWLFPIPEAGRFNGFAPLLGAEEQAAFVSDEMLRGNQQHSLDVMLAFFGMVRKELNILPLPELNMREHIWLKRGGHNHQRISRIIRSLHLCHQTELAAAFQQAVEDIGTTQGVVSEQSVAYWRAAKNP
ncbi:opioid growth factor receptor-related protein [Halomonas vilamensis]|uniref:Opioid growth factor receptor-related protein n=1 Tax=Vreelandella vilamensis TaxID=531309 RepID=A0ABU1H0N1_9GAMM|nr:opioid growth factor receptor-related protein [Halomonas vilamensis]MDR5897670.1 opioid growth factor receptor-related protein [Halomonas vilamensis]